MKAPAIIAKKAQHTEKYAQRRVAPLTESIMRRTPMIP